MATSSAESPRICSAHYIEVAAAGSVIGLAGPPRPQPAPPAAAKAGGPGSAVARIRELKGLLDDGVLTPREFAAKKRVLLEQV